MWNLLISLVVIFAVAWAQTEFQTEALNIIEKYTDGDLNPVDRDSFARCADLLRKAEKVSADPQPLRPKRSFCEAREALLSGDTDKAEQMAKAGLEEADEQADQARLFNLLGTVAIEKEDLSRAVKQFQLAIDQRRLWIYPRNNLALTYAGMHEDRLAEESFCDAIRVRYAGRGGKYSALVDEAFGVLTPASESQQAIPLACQPLYAFWELLPRPAAYLGWPRRDEFEKQTAAAEYEYLDYNLAALLILTGRDREAGRILTRLAISRRMSTPSKASLPLLAENALGILGARQSSDVAESVYRKILREYPDFHVARYNLAVLYINDGRKRKARAELQHLLNALKNSEDDVYKSAQAALARLK